MALLAHGGVVVSGRNVLWKSFSTDIGGENAMLLDRDESAGNEGFNDPTTDEYGRIHMVAVVQVLFLKTVVIQHPETYI